MDESIRTQWRNSWEFAVQQSDVLAAARAQVIASRERLAYWEEQFAAAKADAETKGLRVTDFRETFDNLVKNSTSYAPGPSVSIDEKYVTRIRHCWNRIQYHTARIREFQRWVAVLSLDGPGDDTRLLTADDHAYFWPDPDPSDHDLPPTEGTAA